MTGYIFDHRKELESDVWLLPPMYHRVWQWIKYKVNHSEARIPNKDGTYTVIKPGQHATSYRHIAKGVGYYEGLKWKEPNPKTVKVILDWLQLQEMITVDGNTLGTVITIANWDLYQKDLVKGNAEVTLEKHLLDTNKKNKKELKNDELSNSRFTPPTLEQVKSYCIERKNTIDSSKFIDFYESKGWLVGKVKMKDWKASVRTWEKSQSNITSNGQPFIKPNKFNNFPQTMSGMSESDIDEILRKKEERKKLESAR